MAAHEDDKSTEPTTQDAVEITGVIPEITSRLAGPLSGDASPEAVLPKLAPSPAGLDDFTALLTVEDARAMVDLLKLAVANRVGERGKETLAAVLMAMGKANLEVGGAGMRWVGLG